ncbi:MAG: SGNH/GDSL hydrolase family protein [Verrucomicrobium sp.]
MRWSCFIVPVLCLLVCRALPGAGAPQLTLPPVWYGVPGVPVSFYYDNVVLTEHLEALRFEVKCDLGTAETRRWTVTPEDKDVGEHAMEVVVRDEAGKELERARMLLKISPREAGAGRPLKLLIVGDSLTAATVYPNELARLLSLPGNPAWKMFGQHQPMAAQPGVAHEGYGGWTWAAFLTRHESKEEQTPDGRGWKKRSSPFVFLNDKEAPALDVGRYLRETCGGEKPDVVTFLLGINDCFGANPEAPDKTIDTVLANADQLIAAFREASPGTAIAIGLTTPPNTREGAFQANYTGKYHRWGWKRIQHRLVQRQLEKFSNRENDQIFVVPTELNVDPLNGYPVNNAVHPNAEGYAQIGSSFYAWLKAWLAMQSGAAK